MPEQEVFDLIIVGAGPAGLTAALYAGRAMLSTLVFERESYGGQTILTSEIDNYPGVPHIDGYTLSEQMKAQAVEYGARFVSDTVASISYNFLANLYEIQTPSSLFSAKTVIVAGGATPRLAGFEGEKEFTGHGVSYCATCDGMFYRGKQVFVIGGGNSACEEALFLTRFASNVTLVVRKDHLRAQSIVVRELENNPKVEIRFMTSVVSIEGGNLPSSITFMSNETGELMTERYEEGSFGVFVFVGREPETSLIRDIVDVDRQGYVITDEKMQTKSAGLFCAGDIRSKPLRQVITAASDGAIAATSAAAFLGHPVDS